MTNNTIALQLIKLRAIIKQLYKAINIELENVSDVQLGLLAEQEFLLYSVESYLGKNGLNEIECELVLEFLYQCLNNMPLTNLVIEEDTLSIN
ncbi:hypothetical protein L1D40_13660 [Shewanella insulae]|uniref:hypothetical protein n=1 Tax=Shewanella insulae TaxID=2681496 RepID=UPI001EFE3A1D|nr:hypothetical protein [Shewanella insulae]MCG9714837.1 hypothetical protein [Shewanella insulae]MCG9756258.1 hypothetical protein [Shewanella insulae]